MQGWVHTNTKCVAIACARTADQGRWGEGSGRQRELQITAPQIATRPRCDAPRAGFGFVTFANAQNAKDFVSQKEHFVDGKRVEAKSAVPRQDGVSRTSTKIFVGGTVRCLVGVGWSRLGGEASWGACGPAPQVASDVPAACPAPTTHVQGEITDVEFRSYFEQFGSIKDSVVGCCTSTTPCPPPVTPCTLATPAGHPRTSHRPIPLFPPARHAYLNPHTRHAQTPYRPPASQQSSASMPALTSP
jgi:hypothetical protein